MTIRNRFTEKPIATGDSLREVAMENKADLSGADLSDADLRGADLRGADLRGADLSGTSLRGANLHGANLRGADLRGADLSGADLSGTSLRDANLRGADLSDADLSGADLRGTSLSGANLHGANLIESQCLYATGDFLRLAGTAHPIIASDESNVSVGCIRSTLAKWKESYRTIGEREKYTPDQIEEYGLLLGFVEQWLALRKRQREAK